MNGKLLLADGTVFEGCLLGGGKAAGEVIFHTGMMGYQEVLSDPSYCRQIVVLTYPLIGNCGAAEAFMQSAGSFVQGLVIGELCEVPSHWQTEMSLRDFLLKEEIPCLYNVDTRAVARHIREVGAMPGILLPQEAGAEEGENLLAVQGQSDVVAEVTTPTAYTLENDGPHVVVMDLGVTKSCLQALQGRGCRLTVVPAAATADEILALSPDGIFLSHGPGDPKAVPEISAAVKQLAGQKPLFAMGLGHQVLALALGADTYKLKFVHSGANQPVKDLLTGRVQITSQNHGYAVEEASLAGLPLEITYRSVNYGTIEGLRHKDLPIFSVQFYPEVAADAQNSHFEQFVSLLSKGD